MATLLVASVWPVTGGADELPLPAWFDDARIQAHLTLGPARRGSALNLRANDFVRSLGVSAYTRHVKTDWRPPLWEAALGADRPDDDARRAAELMTRVTEDARDKGLAINAYYWDGGDGNAAFPDDIDFVGSRAERFGTSSEPRRLPEDWLCRTAEGNVVPAGAGARHRGLHADPTSPFREHVSADLNVAVDLGFSGLFFDERHFPDHRRSPCLGSALERRFRRVHGVNGPASAWSARERWLFVSAQAEAMVDTFRYWKTEVNRGRDDVVPFVVSGTYLSSLVYPHMSLALGEAADSIKTEYEHGLRRSLAMPTGSGREGEWISERVTQALAWIIARDAASGRPPYVWKRVLRNVAEARAFVADVILHGGIAAPHVVDAVIDRAGDETMRAAAVRSQLASNTSAEVLREAFRYGGELTELYRSSRPVDEVTLLIDEQALSGAETPQERLRLLVLPLRRLATALSVAGVPYRLLPASRLRSDGRDESIIITLGPVTSDTRRRLRSLAREGKHVVVPEPTRAEREAGMVAVSGSAAATVREALEASPPRYRVRCERGWTRGAQTLTTFARSTVPGRILVGILPAHGRSLDRCSLFLGERPASVRAGLGREPLRVSEVEGKGWSVEFGPVREADVLVIDE